MTAIRTRKTNEYRIGQRETLLDLRRNRIIAEMKASTDQRYVKALEMTDKGCGWEDIQVATKLPISVSKLLAGLWA